jgi:microcystin-dependent protein
MATPYLGEVRAFGFNFAPVGWAMCNGQALPIAQNQALFALLGTTYGGDGVSTFALPDLRGRVSMHFGAGFTQGQKAGEETHTLIANELPAHTHLVNAVASAGTANVPGNTMHLASGVSSSTGNPVANIYASPGSAAAMAPLNATGGSQPHENRMPFLVLNCCIALQGIFPSQN